MNMRPSASLLLCCGIAMLSVVDAHAQRPPLKRRPPVSDDLFKPDTINRVFATDMMHDRWVDDITQANLVGAFNGHFKVTDPNDPGKLVDLRDTVQEIPWAEFRNYVKGFAPSQGGQRGIVFHYGIRPYTDSLVLAFSLVDVTRDPSGATGHWVYDCPMGGCPFYEIHRGGIIAKTPGDLVTWKSTYAKIYIARTRILRCDDLPRYDEFIPLFDTESDMFPWEAELEFLHRQNPAGKTLVISSMTEPQEALTDGIGYHYRHGLILHLLDEAGTPLLDHDQHIQAGITYFYKNRAANIGSMCPPRCKKWVEGSALRRP